MKANIYCDTLHSEVVLYRLYSLSWMVYRKSHPIVPPSINRLLQFLIATTQHSRIRIAIVRPSGCTDLPALLLQSGNGTGQCT